MSLLVFGEDGLEIDTLVPDGLEGYRPMFGSGSEISVSYIWDMLPDDLSDLPYDDRGVIESVWKAQMLHYAGLLSEIVHLDQMGSLIDFPIHLTRKWLKLELDRYEDLYNANPNLLINVGDSIDLLTAGSAAGVQQTYLSLVQTGQHSGAYFQLIGTATENATLRFSWEGSFTTFASPPVDTTTLGPPSPREAWMMLGYDDPSTDVMSPGVFAAVSTAGRVAVVEVRPGKTSRWTVSSETVPAVASGETFVVSFTYAGKRDDLPGRMELTVSSGGATATAAGDVLSRMRMTAWVMMGADTRVRPDAPHVTLLTQDVARSFGVLPLEVTFLDPTLHPQARRIPLLQPRVSDDADLLVQDLDFFVSWDDAATDTYSELRFEEQPPGVLWAENVSFDRQLLEKVYGVLVGADLSASGRDSLELKNRIVALLHGLLAGPHPGPLALALGAIGGVPVALEAGEVLYVDSSGSDPEIVVRGPEQDRRYRYPAGLRPLVAVGDLVEKLDPLVEVPVVRDWTAGRSFVSRMNLGQPGARLTYEIQKYSAIHVEVPFGSLGTSAEDEGPDDYIHKVFEYWERAVALWVGTFRLFLSLVARVSDDAEIKDNIDFEAELYLRDALTNGLDPRYNDERDFSYDGSFVYNSGSLDILVDRLQAEVTNTTGAPVNVFIFDKSYSIPTLGTVTVSEPD